MNTAPRFIAILLLLCLPASALAQTEKKTEDKEETTEKVNFRLVKRGKASKAVAKQLVENPVLGDRLVIDGDNVIAKEGVFLYQSVEAKSYLVLDRDPKWKEVPELISSESFPGHEREDGTYVYYSCSCNGEPVPYYEGGMQKNTGGSGVCQFYREYTPDRHFTDFTRCMGFCDGKCLWREQVVSEGSGSE